LAYAPQAKTGLQGHRSAPKGARGSWM